MSIFEVSYMYNKVVCFNKNHPIFTCELDDDTAIISKIYEVIDEKHLPIILQDGDFNIDNVNAWNLMRKIPDKRIGLSAIKTEFPKLLHYHNMFSLSDQYWFQHNQKETYNKLNYFNNSYYYELGKAFLSPWEVEKQTVRKESPDLTTNGVLPKRWIQMEDGTSYLIKAGSKDANQSPITEILASMFLERLDIIPFVKYELKADGLKMCSICRNFIDSNTEFVPLTHVYNKVPRNKPKETVFNHIVKQSVSYGLNENYVKNYLYNMIAADAIIQNHDRHLNNFGYIRDVESGKILKFAPLFDSGSAFTEENNNKMFKDYKRKALNKTFESLEIEDFSSEPMLKMVAAFPTLNRETKLMIKKKILESTEMIIKGGKKREAKELIEVLSL